MGTLRRSHFAFLAVALAACGGHAQESQTNAAALLGEDGADASEIETHSSSLTAAFALGPTAAPMRDVDTIVAAAGQATEYFAPAGCLNVTSDTASHTVTYALDECAGPWGLARVSGTVVATYAMTTASNGGMVLTIAASSEALRFDRATASWHATASVTASGLAREMAWDGTLSGTTARGRAFTRTAEWDAKWSVGDSCVSLAGTAEGDVGARAIATTVRGYVRCRHECPLAGGDITVVDTSNGRSIDVSFTGTDVALVHANGTTYDVALACNP
jgi:hypothetical protein